MSVLFSFEVHFIYIYILLPPSKGVVMCNHVLPLAPIGRLIDLANRPKSYVYCAMLPINDHQLL